MAVAVHVSEDAERFETLYDGIWQLRSIVALLSLLGVCGGQSLSSELLERMPKHWNDSIVECSVNIGKRANQSCELSIRD